jgi:acyl-CoA synthetase (AMP-forming)/AMP-acid ligase II
MTLSLNSVGDSSFPDMIPHPVSRNATRFPHEDALLWGGRSLSWRQLEEYIRSTARQLKEIGVRENVRVGVAGENSVSYVVLLYALWELKASVMLIDARLPLQEMARVAEASGCVLVFTEPLLEKVFSRKTRMIADAVAFDAVSAYFDVKAGVLFDIDGDKEAFLMASCCPLKGPVLVPYTFNAIYRDVLAALVMMPSLASGPWRLTRPFSSLSGIAVMLLSLAGGGAIVIKNE